MWITRRRERGINHEHPVKEIVSGMTLALGMAFKGFAFESWVTVTEFGMQSLVPPLSGIKALARMEYKTSPGAGVEYAVIFPAENMPTLGLLAGSMRV